MKTKLLIAAALLCASAGVLAQKKDAAGVSFVEPKNGATVPEEFKVVMGVKGMAIAPAGEEKPGTGHHHLIVDAPPVKKGEVIPADEHHLHFGKGQTETTLKLPPGKHRLQLQFADGAHRSYGPSMRRTITVVVKAAPPPSK